jgi:sugar phosphate isomerase/epimerase
MKRIFSLAPLTLIEQTPPELVATAAQAGYDAVGLRLNPFRGGEAQHPMLGDTPMMRETEARLRDTGLRVLDIEVLLLTPERAVDDFEPVLQAGARLGAGHALVLIDIKERALAAAKFAQLCELAAPFGICCALEFAAWLGVGTLQEADAVLSAAAQPNGALLLDPFHLSRSGGGPADLASIDPARIRYAQFCDAAASVPATMPAISEEARYDRIFPGHGGLPLRAFLQALPAGVPLALEIPNRRLAQAMPPLERVRRALLAAKEVDAEI